MCNLEDYAPFNEWIAKEDMIANKTYFCKGRNFTIGIWNGERFEYMREKWGTTYPATEDHWDDGAPFGTVKPFKILED